MEIALADNLATWSQYAGKVSTGRLELGGRLTTYGFNTAFYPNAVGRGSRGTHSALLMQYCPQKGVHGQQRVQLCKTKRAITNQPERWYDYSMDKKHITHAIDHVISEAGRAKGWSLAKLTRYLGKGSNTLHRWKTGQTTAYDMEALIELFKMAEMSMDQTFELMSAEEAAAPSQEQHEALLRRLDRLDRELAHLRPLANLTAAISGIVTAFGATATAADDDAIMAERAAASYELAHLQKSESQAAELSSKIASKLSRREANRGNRKAKPGA